MNTYNRNYESFPSDEISLVLDESRINRGDMTTDDFIPAVPTLYTPENKIDYDVLSDLLEKYHNSGVEGVLIAGTTGESSLLAKQEHLDYIGEAVRMANNYGMRVYAGTGSNSTREQNYLTENAFELGAHASLLLPPYYIKTSPSGLIRHFTEGLNHGPAIIYSIAGRTGIPIPLEVLVELSRHPNFLGVKECDGGDRIRYLRERGIRVWTGNDDEAFTNTHDDEAQGVISVVGNLDPDLVGRIISSKNEVIEDVQRLLDLSALMFPEGQPNPIAIHNAIEMNRRAVLGITTPAVFRGAVGPLNIRQQEYLASGLNDLNIPAKVYGDNLKTFG